MDMDGRALVARTPASRVQLVNLVKPYWLLIAEWSGGYENTEDKNPNKILGVWF